MRNWRCQECWPESARSGWITNGAGRLLWGIWNPVRSSPAFGGIGDPEHGDQGIRNTICPVALASEAPIARIGQHHFGAGRQMMWGILRDALGGSACWSAAGRAGRRDSPARLQTTFRLAPAHFGSWQVKLTASSMLPPPLYVATQIVDLQRAQQCRPGNRPERGNLLRPCERDFPSGKISGHGGAEIVTAVAHQGF